MFFVLKFPLDLVKNAILFLIKIDGALILPTFIISGGIQNKNVTGDTYIS